MGKESFDEQILVGRDCYLGIDLARNFDIGAVMLVFPIDEVYYLLPRFFLPSNCLVDRERNDHVSYSSWVQRGFLTLTPGDVIDYAFFPPTGEGRRAAPQDPGNRLRSVERRVAVQLAALSGGRVPSGRSATDDVRNGAGHRALR
jgi:hypothetical protein